MGNSGEGPISKNESKALVEFEGISVNSDQQTLPFGKSIQERFEAFDGKHPEVYGYMVGLCRELRHRGFKHYGVRPLYERARWHFQVERDMGDEFKLNDHYISRYARKIMAQNPELEGFFELRELKAA